MFGLYTVTAVKKSSKKDLTPPPSPPTDGNDFVSNSLEPAIDGPPSPERIRAYTEQMKRSSLFGNNSRTNTLSSATSSFRSRESTSGSTDNVSLSRKSSGRSSNASSMPSIRSERPESVQIFGSIFSRSGRKSRREHNASSLRTSGSSTTLDESVIEEESAKEHYYGKRSVSRRRHLISGPYNFQHVTHTRQDHLPNLERTSRMDLVSEFSAIRASQAPTHGELKGIRAEDLHFENFSSEALALTPTEELSPNSSTRPRHRAVLRKSVNQLQRTMPYAKSHDELRIAPPRPPRSPLSPECPVALPARTSSRTASVLFDTFDPLASTTIERPYTNGGFRRPAPFHLPIPPPPSWDERKEDFSNRPLSHAVTTPGDEAWPLTASPSGNFGVELTDVQEEDEDVLSRRSRFSTASAELRMSQSVPALRRKSVEQANDKQEMASSTTPLPEATSSSHELQQAPAFQFTTDSWESDIDWCYEHEVEADCNYDWDRCSAVEANAAGESVSTTSQPALQLRLQNEERTYHGRFRPSLLVPSPSDLPELSPVSIMSTPSDPRTPNFLRPAHVRSPSHASSFKETHGFTLSPTLLIPSDFQSQMDQDSIYNEHFGNDSTSGTIFAPEPFEHSVSPVDEGASSTASFRSSDFSRGSARSSSSTRVSANSRGSQDSMILLARAASLSQEHRSIGSASSLPDLIRSSHRPEVDVSSSIAALTISNDEGVAPAITSLQHRRNKSLAMENGRRMGETHAAPTPAMLTIEKTDLVEPSSALSPVAEFPAMPKEAVVRPLVHGRKTSAPVVSPSVKAFKGRARAKTSATRGSYVLFPQN
ncbi:uncharacterized protein LY89DRAFT_191225 [Mollisia scopiformis]|uniref:CRIB domain-containing protein n=1 Tax=Mollisia scopiformis TaxID=149040 RepID=A0A194WXL3_MOLSC|nr:uncharacterized protein LY89DRAFT_191225 [Mollisia scopiformis]KUJ12721.1 hypothetical protein LY89DRAFT_191225 [Mollisia scopiformis]